MPKKWLKRKLGREKRTPNSYTEKIVISVGGSLIIPNGGIDKEFLCKLNKFIRNQLARNKHRQFFLITGGGKTTRHYQKAAMDVVGKLANEDLDWIGIHATRLNAHLVRTIFRDIAHPYIIKDYETILKPIEPVVIASGWKPGWSTDYDAVIICEDYGAKQIINLSNINMAYDKDPKKYKDAKPIRKTTWREFRKIVGSKWTPGMNAPFDPIAAKKAEELKLKAVLMSGKNFENLNNFLDGNKFVGTVIE